MSLEAGSRLGSYTIEAPLAGGVPGEVYRARDSRNSRESHAVAVKQLAGGTDEAETRTWTALRHPAIVRMHEIVAVDESRYAAFDLVEGRPLERVLAEGELSVHAAIAIGCELAGALAAVHQAGLVHGRLSPAAVMVDAAGDARLLAPGLVEPVSDRNYLSPEVARGEAATPQSDIYSLGALLAALLRGPAAHVAAPICRIVERCREPLLSERFHSAADLAFSLGGVATPTEGSAGDGIPWRRDWALALFALACVGLATATWFLKPTVRQPVYDITPLTAFNGSERQPALSPDGKQLAFVWTGEPADQPGVYVKPASAGGQPHRISAANETALYPCWSADGREVAFVRASDDGTVAVLAAPPAGGTERKIAEYQGRVSPIDWSPNGRWIAATESDGGGESIFAIAASGGDRRRLTAAQPHTRDRTPAFSPDGHSLAYLEESSPWSMRLRIVKLNAEGIPQGNPRTVGSRIWTAASVDWMPDSKRLVVPSLAGGNLQFWSVAASGDDARRLPLEMPIDSDLFVGQISVRGGRMAVASVSLQYSIGRMVRNAAGQFETAPFYSSSRSDQEPQVSPDGRRVVFTSTRSGNREVWVADADGSNAAQLTTFKGARTASPRWSPDGRTIVFEAFADGNSDIWTVSIDGGPAKRLTNSPSNEVRPSYSRDGRWIYFGWDRDEARIWKMPAGGGEPQQVTAGEGFEAFESLRGDWLYFARQSSYGREIFRMPPAGGSEEMVASDALGRAWAVDGAGVYLGLTRPPRVISVDPGSGVRREICRLPEGLTSFGFATSLSVSADGAAIYRAQVRRDDSDILLVENFK